MSKVKRRINQKYWKNKGQVRETFVSFGLAFVLTKRREK